MYISEYKRIFLFQSFSDILIFIFHNTLFGWDIYIMINIDLKVV